MHNRLTRGLAFFGAAALAAASALAQGGAEGKNAPGTPKSVTFYRRANVRIDGAPDNGKVQAEIERFSGIRVSTMTIPPDAYQEKINLMLAAGESFDGFAFDGFGGHHWTEFAEKKALLPLNDLIDKYGPHIKERLADGFKCVSAKDGTIYGIPRAEEFPMGFVLTLRSDWLAKFKMQTPSTVAELEAYFEAVKTRDPNGNGLNDEIPLLPSWGFGGLENALAPYYLGFYGQRYLDAERGAVLPIYAHPGYAEMLAKIREWYEKGYLFKEYLTVKRNMINDLVVADRVAVRAGWFNSGTDLLPQLRTKTPDAAWSVTAPLKGGRYAPGYASNPAFSAQIVVPSTSKDPKAIIQYIDWMLADKDNYHSAMKGIRGEHWDWTDRAASVWKTVPAAQSSERYDGLFGILEVAGIEEFRGTYDTEGDVRSAANEAVKDAIRGSKAVFYEPFDSFVPYTVKGTPAERLTGDGTTLLTEARAKYIMGLIDLAGYRKALEKYMQVEGNILADVWTKQYKDFVKR